MDPVNKKARHEIVECFDQVNYGVAIQQSSVLLEHLDEYSLQQIRDMFNIVKTGQAIELGELEYYYCMALKRSYYLWDDKTRSEITFPEFINHFFSTLYVEYSHPFRLLKERISLYRVEIIDDSTAVGEGVGGTYQTYEDLQFSKEGGQWKFNLFSMLDRSKNINCDMRKNGKTDHRFIYNSSTPIALQLPRTVPSEQIAKRAIVVTSKAQLQALPNLYQPAAIKALTVDFNKVALEDGSLLSALSIYQNLEYLSIRLGPDPLGINTIEQQVGPYLGQLQRLKTLIIKNSLLVIPKELANLEGLEKLEISGRKLDQFPNKILELQQLKDLIFYDNRFRTIPPKISYLKNLEKLDIGSICDLPEEISSLLKLEHLSVYIDKIEDLEQIGQMKSLKKLDLISNERIEEIGPLSKLRQLKSLSITILGKLDGIENLKLLEDLSLRGGGLLAPENLEVIGKLKKLRRLKVADIYPMQRLPTFIQKLPRLEHLDIQARALTNLDISCKNMKQLKYVKIYTRDYSGFPLKLCGAPIVIFDPRYRFRTLLNNNISRWHLEAQKLQFYYTKKVQEYMRENRQTLNIERGRERRARSLLTYFRFDYKYDKESYTSPIRLELALKESVQYEDVEELVGILKQYNEEVLKAKKKFGLEGSYW